MDVKKENTPEGWKNRPPGGVTIVSDPGLDDLLALVLLQKLAPETPKLLLPTFGNMDAEATAQNARDFLGVADDSWALGQGAVRPLGKQLDEAWIDSKQGANGLWDIRPETNERATASGDAVRNKRVISLAPLTDIVGLLQAGQVRDLLIMGGVFDRFAENGNPAELNVRFDADAAKWVFENCAQTSVKLVPAEVAFDVAWPLAMVQSIPETNPTNRWLKRILLAGFENGRYVSGNELYDPLAILLAFYPEYAEWRRSGVAVITEGNRRGETVLTNRNSACDIAVKVSEPEVVAQRLFDLIFFDDVSSKE